MKRYCILDGIRGLAVVSMVLYHLCWDLVNLAGVRLWWFNALPGRLWQMSICLTFIALSGFCRALGRRHLRRGMTVLLGGVAVSAATLLVTPENAVHYGILTLIGSCMLLTAPFDKQLGMVPPAAGLTVSSALFALTWGVENGTAVFGLVRPFGWLYRGQAAAFFGFPPAGFRSADYFPLLPWAFLFAAGYFLCGVFRRRDWLRRLERRGLRPLEWVGRHALWIYLLHQPVLAGAVWLATAVR